MHDILTEVTASSYTLYPSCVYIPMNNSKITYKALIKKKGKTTDTKNQHLDFSGTSQNTSKAAAKPEDV